MGEVCHSEIRQQVLRALAKWDGADDAELCRLLALTTGSPHWASAAKTIEDEQQRTLYGLLPVGVGLSE
jgi:hypothetical protein